MNIKILCTPFPTSTRLAHKKVKLVAVKHWVLAVKEYIVRHFIHSNSVFYRLETPLSLVLFLFFAY